MTDLAGSLIRVWVSTGVLVAGLLLIYQGAHHRGPLGRTFVDIGPYTPPIAVTARRPAQFQRPSDATTVPRRSALAPPDGLTDLFSLGLMVLLLLRSVWLTIGIVRATPLGLPERERTT